MHVGEAGQHQLCHREREREREGVRAKEKGREGGGKKNRKLSR